MLPQRDRDSLCAFQHHFPSSRNPVPYSPSGQSLSVDLDDCDFIVARRAVTLPKHLNALLAEGKVKEAGESLKAYVRTVLRLLSKRYAIEMWQSLTTMDL